MQFSTTANTILAMKVHHKRFRFLCLISDAGNCFSCQRKNNYTKKKNTKQLSNKNSTREYSHNFILPFLISFYCICPLYTLPSYSTAQLVLMCYVNLSHILFFTKYTPQNLLIKWLKIWLMAQSASQQPNQQAEQKTRPKKHRKPTRALWLCNNWESSSTLLQEHPTEPGFFSLGLLSWLLGI